ncbi:hypothetical protein LshimejAT787_0106800 [Lyophyllum shimeji]|uniref:Uncharacterized protein n=1 Tax=Lyophyllum shimeji TaxID=47721 RepID=A0A9P3PE44_LYOSH|nr:hypothetical protein LshimejAT787_0106800 [Lyophyllum shimeji]
MCSSFKRVLTDEERQSLVASSTAPESTPDDLAARLRSVGSRVRKHVMEGYTSPPPSFTKSNSTPTIFCSAHDTLREVYAPSNASSARVASERKRARPQGDQGYDSDGGIDEDRDAEMGLVNQESDEDGVSIIVGPDAKSLGRPIKALRKPRRAMLATRSLPATSFAFGNNRPNNESTMNTVKEEEDWSAGNFVAQSFEEAGYPKYAVP